MITDQARIIENVFGELPELETERLVLRKIRMDDASDMFEYASDPEISKYVLWNSHNTIEESRAVIAMFVRSYEKKEIENWGIASKKTGRLIGTCGYFYWNPEYRRAEIQYALSRKYWGKGLMTEAVTEVLKFGFERMDLNRVEAKCMLDNTASERVMQKLGMKFEGIMREAVMAKDKFFDLKVYAILKREFSFGGNI